MVRVYDTDQAEDERVVDNLELVGAQRNVQKRNEVAEKGEKVGERDEEKGHVLEEELDIGHLFDDIPRDVETVFATALVVFELCLTQANVAAYERGHILGVMFFTEI